MPARPANNFRQKIAGPMSKFMTQNVKNTLQAAIARMVALDGIPVRLFITSPDIQKRLEAQDFSISTVQNRKKQKKTAIDHGKSINWR